MERTFHRFISLIRFFYISSEDFLFKVYPFKVLLPEDLIALHMTPNKEPNVDIPPPRNTRQFSILVKNRHFAIFSSWIDEKGDLHYNQMMVLYSHL